MKFNEPTNNRANNGSKNFQTSIHMIYVDVFLYPLSSNCSFFVDVNKTFFTCCTVASRACFKQVYKSSIFHTINNYNVGEKRVYTSLTRQ